MISVLVVEDDASQRAALEEYLAGLREPDTFSVYAAPTLDLGRAVLTERRIDCVISDLMLPDGTGIELLQEARRKQPTMPFLILTGQPAVETAVEAIKAGATDYLIKPVDFALLKHKLTGFDESIRLRRENKSLRRRLSETFDSGKVIGNAPSLRAALERARQVAGTDVTVLLEGESGTGKELFANVIQMNSARADNEFIRVNCGALTKTLLESELFGTVKGAYTGADRDRAGFFEAADGGALFLDEIGEMDLESQVRLLRVIEEREVVRVGSTKPIKVDVRLIAATNRSLLDQVNRGEFREDLYYRLAVIRINLPPLRERKEDLPILFNHYVTQLNEQYGRSVTMLAPDLLRFFETYDWPGNIRQFRNILEGMIVLARDDVLSAADLPEELRQPRPQGPGRHLVDSIQPGVPMSDYERIIIAKNLAYTGGNREKTASLLGISERTLYRKIKEFDLQG